MRKILNGCYTACGVVSGLALVGIVAFVLIQIVARPLGLVVSWSAEFAGYAMAASSFWAWPTHSTPGGIFGSICWPIACPKARSAGLSACAC